MEYEDASPQEKANPEMLMPPKEELGLAVKHKALGTSVSIPFSVNYMDIFLNLMGWFI